MNKSDYKFAIDCITATISSYIIDTASAEELAECLERCAKAIKNAKEPQNASDLPWANQEPSLAGRSRNIEHESTCESIGRDEIGDFYQRNHAETLDLMRDEFSRIAAEDSASENIKHLCRRAILQITCRVPLIAQRDRAERELLISRIAITKALDCLEVNIDIDGNTLGDSDAARHLRKALPQPTPNPLI